MHTHHDPTLVILSVLLAMIASFTALDLANRVNSSTRRLRPAWLAGGALAMGIGIWSMHFTGMLAFSLDRPIGYQAPLLILSVVIAVAASLLALGMMTRERVGLRSVLMAGLFMGAAIAGMHYTGMAALQTHALLSYSPSLVALSVAIAIGASIVALRLSAHYRDELTNRALLGKLGSAAVMGSAIAGLHYTAMAAATFTPLPGEPPPLQSWVVADPGLAAMVVVATLTILGFTLLTIMVDRWRVAAAAEAAALRSSEAKLRELHDELQRERDFLSTVLQHISDAVMVVDADGKLVMLNSAARALEGSTGGLETTAAGADVHRLLTPDGSRELEPHESPLQLALQGEPVTKVEVATRTGDGELLSFQANGQALRDKHGELVGAVMVLHNITERKKADAERECLLAELKRFNEDLERRVTMRTSELQAVNRELEAFTYSASHDLRAPLRGIDGFSQALLEDYGDAFDETARRYVDRIRHGAKRMGELIDDLLMLSRLNRRELRPRAVDLGEISRQVLAKLAEDDPSRRLAAVVEEDLQAWGDEGLLRIVLENLIGNAWKFTRDRATACITVGRLPEDETVFYVRDNGAGFDMEYSEKLFVPFGRLHRASEFDGSGIGLATVQRIVHRHGGEVWGESKPDQGATFYFSLPAPAPVPAGEGHPDAATVAGTPNVTLE